MHTVHAEQDVTTRARINGGGRVGAPRSVRHVEVLEIDQAAWSLLILGDLGPYPPLCRRRVETDPLTTDWD